MYILTICPISHSACLPNRDLTRQLRRERGVKLSPVDDPHDISHEALCALSQDQIYSLMTSNSVNYDIIHHIMQLKKMAEEEGTRVKVRARRRAMVECAERREWGWGTRGGVSSLMLI